MSLYNDLLLRCPPPPPPRKQCWPVLHWQSLYLRTRPGKAYIVNQSVQKKPQTTYIYKEYHSVCPLVGIATLLTPLLPASVPLTLEPGGGGVGTLACGWGVGGVPIPTAGEKASHSAYSVRKKNQSIYTLPVYIQYILGCGDYLSIPRVGVCRCKVNF